MPRVLMGSIAEMRASISRAALLVKVTASMPPGPTCPVWISQAMRVVSTRVLPLPAPARISADSLRQGNCRELLWIQTAEDVAGVHVDAGRRIRSIILPAAVA